MAVIYNFVKAVLLMAVLVCINPGCVWAQDYTITTAGNALVVTDVTGTGETITVSENGSNIRFQVAGKTYSVNGGATTAFNVTPADIPLANLTSVTINAAAGSDIVNLGAFVANLPALTINGGTGDDIINFNGNLLFAANASLNVNLQNDDSSPGADIINLTNGADLLLSGTGTVDFIVSKNIVFGANTTLRTVNGNMRLEANQQSVVTPGLYYGIHAYASSVLIESTGSGSITIKGRGGDVFGANNHGVAVGAGSIIRGGTSGTLTIEGLGGSYSDQGGFGVLVSGNNAAITSLGANVSITGSGGPIGVWHNHGVVLDGAVNVSAGGSGTLTIVGTGGYSGDNINYGVYLSSGAAVTSSGGNVSVTGNGGSFTLGSGGYNHGVYMYLNSVISAGGNGSVTVTGTSGLSDGASPYNDGIRLESNSSITSSGGPVQVTGNAVLEPQSQGVNIMSGGCITSGGTGAVTVTGNNGTQYGVAISGTNSRIVSAGAINVNCTAITNTAFYISNSGYVANNTAGGTINITANSMSINTPCSIYTTASGQVTLSQLTNGTTINVGGADASGTLGLTNTELDQVLTPTPVLVMGNANTGPVTISAAISRSYATNVTVYGNPVSPDFAGTDLSLSGGTLTLGTGSKLNIDIDGPTPGTQYKQLTVAGQVNLNNATLTFTGSTHTPVPVQQFVILDNDNTDAVTGTFSGLPEGTIINNFLGTANGAQISYTGGTGNDVVLTVIPLLNWYLDTDNDSYYIAGPVSAYTSPGAGYNTTATTSGDCDDNNNTKWQLLNGYVDTDGDGYTVDSQVSICSGFNLPIGYTAVSSGSDCNDNNPSVLVTQTWYLDTDNDGYYTSVQNVCNSPGSGWTLTATTSGDCDNNDNTKWQFLTGYADADGDGYTTGGLISVCSGATLPTGYAATSLGTDCDDNNTAATVSQTWYLDADNDGYYISAQTSCTSPGAGYNTTATTSGDCDDNDDTKWQNLNAYVDADGDGYTTGGLISVCSGATVPTGYAATSLGTDCNDNDTSATVSQTWYLDADNDGYYVSAQTSCTSPGAGYNTTAATSGDCDDNDDTKWQNLNVYVDADSDGYTTGGLISVCSGATLPTGYAATSLGTDCDDNNTAATVSQTWYLDADNDGYYISSQTSCTSPGAGYNTTATTSGDCDDNDDTKWQNLNAYIDADGDGYTIGGLISVCSGATLPTGYAATSLGTDCDDNNTAATVSQTWYLDTDNDGYYISSVISCGSPGIGYNITATDSGDCNDNNDTILGAPCEPTAINETYGTNTIITDAKLYPNPTASLCKITFNLKKHIPYTLQLYNALGELIHTKQLTGLVGENAVELNMNNYTTGVYFISVNENDVRLWLRTIKQ